MKLSVFALISIVFVSVGCASKVTTYDAQGRVIGSCVSSKGFVLGASASCTGTANQEGRN